MSDNPDKTLPNDPAADLAVGNPDPGMGDDPAGGPVDQPVAAVRLAELEAQAAEYKDKLLRALAEAENVRRRAERDKEEASKYAIANFARAMLAVADNLRRALTSIPAEAREADSAIATLATGVEMTEREMLATFDKFGIRPVEALGRKVDANFHEALFEIEDSSQPVGTVVQVLETGYVLGERLLRPARVGVAKGGPKDGAPAPANDPGEASTRPGAAQATAYERRADAAKDDSPGPGVDRKV